MNKPSYNPYHDVNLIAQLADLKEVDYKNTLVITALVELLVEKGIIRRSELLRKTKELEVDLPLDMFLHADTFHDEPFHNDAFHDDTPHDEAMQDRNKRT